MTTDPIEALLAAANAELTTRELKIDESGQADEKRRCAADVVHWINAWVWSYDPRLIGQVAADGSRQSPFIKITLWPRQVEAIEFLGRQVRDQAEWAAEKSRDVGFSYLIVMKALHSWLFEPGFKATFGSYLADKVDKRDDPDSLFEKARIILRRLPAWMLPEGFSFQNHDFFMRLINPETGATITGEAGVNMGRGGRATMYVLDEAAHVEHAEAIEAALAGTTDCVGWVSTSNGTGCLFYRKLLALPPERKFRFHWRDDPRKNDAWAAKKQASLTEPTAWASEFEIDHSASMEGIVIPGKWVEAARRLGDLLDLRPGPAFSGMDVGGGKAKSVHIVREGPIVRPPASRGQPDTDDTARWGLELSAAAGVRIMNFDAVGIGAGVASTLKKANKPGGMVVQPINVGDSPTDRVWPDGRTSDEMFGNLKGEIWWLAREALKRTYEMVLFFDHAEGGKEHALSDLIYIEPGRTVEEKAEVATLVNQLSLVRWFRNERGKIVIETKDQLKRRGVPSPDYAEAYVLTYVEERRSSAQGWLDYARERYQAKHAKAGAA